jgi:hypothetical protein
MVIRKVSNGVITTVAGGGTGCSQQTDPLGDGWPATSAPLNDPVGVAVDTAGNVYIADANDRVVRMVSNGIITTAAPVAPGSIAAAFGVFPLSAPVIDTKWPTSISGLSLQFGDGKLAPLFFASGGQVNFQVP